MKLGRLSVIIGMNLRTGALARGNYLKKKKVFAFVGEQVRFQPRVIPPYSELISFHNNIMVGSGVRFVTHDAAHVILKGLGLVEFHEMVGCIEVMDNVFIGTDAIILPNVRIGKNVIIGAGALVCKDCEANSVYAGVPARRIGSFDDFVAKRQKGNYPTVARTQCVTDEEREAAWKAFQCSRAEE